MREIDQLLFAPQCPQQLRLVCVEHRSPKPCPGLTHGWQGASIWTIFCFTSAISKKLNQTQISQGSNYCATNKDAGIVGGCSARWATAPAPLSHFKQRTWSLSDFVMCRTPGSNFDECCGSFYLEFFWKCRIIFHSGGINRVPMYCRNDFLLFQIPDYQAKCQIL